MFRIELKRIIVNNRFWLKGIVVMVFLLVIAISNITVENLNIERVKDRYLEILYANDLEGIYTSDKEKVLEALEEKNEEALGESKKIWREFERGEVDFETYSAMRVESEKQNEEKNALREVRKQVTFAKENEKLYISYINGWGNIFVQHQEWIRILIILLYVYFVWKNEVDKGVKKSLKITKRGGKTLFRAKTFCITLSILVMYLLEQAIFIWYIQNKFGRHGINASIQTVYIFSELNEIWTIGRFIWVFEIFKLLVVIGAGLFFSVLMVGINDKRMSLLLGLGIIGGLFMSGTSYVELYKGAGLSALVVAGLICGIMYGVGRTLWKKR